MFFLLFFQILVGIIVTSSNCPSGASPSSSNPNQCIYFGLQKLPYMNAEEKCLQLGGHLATTHTVGEDMDLSEKADIFFNGTGAGVDFWIGANKINGNWAWLDGSEFEFADWDFSEPNDHPNNVCAAMSLITTKWSAKNCLKNKPYVCEFAVKEKTTITSSTSINLPKSTSPNY